MRYFSVNSASFKGQFYDLNDCYTHFSELIESIKYIWPMVQRKRAELLIHPNIHEGRLREEEDLKVTVQALRAINKDLSTLWYIYLKNRPEIDHASQQVATITPFSNPKPGLTISIDTFVLDSGARWLSVGGTEIGECARLNVFHAGRNYTVENGHNSAAIMAALPYFKHSPKHGALPYYDSIRKEQVAGMPLRDEGVAGNLVRCGLKYGEDIFSYDERTKRFFRFKLTLGLEYHGFEIDREEVPKKLLQVIFELND